jgi:hypothetical protein
MRLGVARGFLMILAAGLALGAGVSAAAALECPVLQSLDGAKDQPDLSGPLSSKDILSQIPGMFAILQQKYPGVSKPQLVNYLIAAYCPVVKGDASLSEQEKQARIREFADRAVSKAY